MSSDRTLPVRSLRSAARRELHHVPLTRGLTMAEGKKGTGRGGTTKSASGGRSSTSAGRSAAGGKAAGGKSAGGAAKTGARGKASSGEKKPRQATGGITRPVQPDAQLSAVVGNGPIPRSELTKKIWDYVKKNGLQDSKNRRMINADAKLRPIFGKDQVSMFEMTKLVNQHVK